MFPLFISNKRNGRFCIVMFLFKKSYEKIDILNQNLSRTKLKKPQFLPTMFNSI